MYKREKFAEPRSWALKWVFAEEAPSVPEARAGARKKFAEPQGWAMKWDGGALTEAGTRRNDES